MKEWKVKTNVMMQMNEHKIIRLKWMNEKQKLQVYLVNEWMNIKRTKQAWWMNEINVKASCILDEWMNEMQEHTH